MGTALLCLLLLAAVVPAWGQGFASASSEFRVNTTIAYNQEEPSVAGLAAGGFVVTWMDANQDGSGRGIYGQCFDAAGTAVGSEFQINTQTSSHQQYPSVAAISGGGFVVTWQSYQQDGSYYGQTEATSDEALEYASPIPQLGGEGYEHLYDELKDVAASIGYNVTLDPATTTEGYCAFRRRLIGIRAGMTAGSKAATLAHELAHALAHDPDEEGERLGHAARELQAEGAAYLACYALGLNTSKASLPYLAHYERDGQEVEAHLKVIDRIAWQIVDVVG